MVQWLRLSASTAGGTSLSPVWGNKIPHAKQYSQIKKQKLLKKKEKIYTKNVASKRLWGQGQVVCAAQGPKLPQGSSCLPSPSPCLQSVQ